MHFSERIRIPRIGGVKPFKEKTLGKFLRLPGKRYRTCDIANTLAGILWKILIIERNITSQINIGLKGVKIIEFLPMITT